MTGWALTLLTVSVMMAGTSAHAQTPTEVKGEAILKHPIGALALKSAELLAAGRIDEVFALRTKSEQSDWKGASAPTGPAGNVLASSVMEGDQWKIAQ